MTKIQLLLFVVAIFSFSCNSNGQNENKTSETLKTTKIKAEKQNTKSEKELSFVFFGDLMQHDLQIQSAYRPKTDKYDFSSVFKYVKPIFDTTDVVIGNLEVTFGGKPYKGYPKFSSPKDLAYEIKKAGIDYLVEANNHIYDKGKKGFEKTLKHLEKVGFKHTGAFLNEEDKKKRHPMIIEKNGFKVAVYNYTYGLNDGIKEAKPNIVNFIDKELIKKDLQNSKSKNYDAVIVFFHWGIEYKHQPNNDQTTLAKLCFENGANIVIGSHPHVINRVEKYEYESKNVKKKDVFIAYSLGNFVSNYGTWRYCDGGLMVNFKIKKSKSGEIKITNQQYIPVWVYRPIRKGKLRDYYVLPVAKFENNKKFMSKADRKQMKTFINDTRTLLNKENKNVPEWKAN